MNAKKISLVYINSIDDYLLYLAFKFIFNNPFDYGLRSLYNFIICF